MGKIRDMVTRLSRTTPVVVERKVLELVRQTEDSATDLNIIQQREGKEATGADITPYYTPFTVRVKQAKGQIADHVTLEDEGDFHRGFFIKAQRFPIVFDSRDDKAEMLKEKYGEDIFGLTKPNLTEYSRKDILPRLQEWFRKILHLR